MYKLFINIIALFFICLNSALYAEPTVLEIIPLNYRNVDEIIPLIRPFIGQEGTLSGMQNQLIIRATPANLAQVKQILATIDRKPQQLMISVRQSSQSQNNRDEIAMSGSIKIGKQGRVTLPDTGQPQGATIGGINSNSPRVRILSSNGNENADTTHQVRTLEGKQAFINIGQSIPVPQQTVTRTINGTVITDSVNYQNVTSGFYVTPRLNRDLVTLEIGTQNDTPGNQGLGSANIQRAATTVSTRLGEWVSIGGVDQNQARGGNVNLSNDRLVTQDSRSIQLKVDLVN